MVTTCRHGYYVTRHGFITRNFVQSLASHAFPQKYFLPSFIGSPEECVFSELPIVLFYKYLLVVMIKH